MRNSVRWAALAALLGQFSCGSDPSPQMDTRSIAPFGSAGAPGNAMTPAQSTPPSELAPPPGATDAPPTNDTPPAEGQPTPVLTPPPPPEMNTGEMPPLDPDAMEAPPPPAGPLVPPSTLPPFGAGGVPQPAGAVGGLRVLNWAGFAAAISYTFDDTLASQIQHYQELNALDVPMTFYLITAGNPYAQNLQDPVWRQALQDGHELGNHTATHQNTGGPNLPGDTDTGEATLERMFGITVYTMAAPFGADDYINIASTRYLINRDTQDVPILANDATNPFSLPCFIPPTNATTAMFNAKVDDTRTRGAWRTVLVHGFTNSASDGAFQPVDISQFTAGVRYTKSLGNVWTDTVVKVGAYWRAQKTFSTLTPATANGSSTWTWTLPDHFPPGQYLRVTVTGGTLRQGDATVPWDPHGYYEIALDRGSVRLSP